MFAARRRSFGSPTRAEALVLGQNCASLVTKIRVSGDNEHGAAALYSQQQAYITYLFYILTYLHTYFTYLLC